MSRNKEPDKGGKKEKKRGGKGFVKFLVFLVIILLLLLVLLYIFGDGFGFGGGGDGEDVPAMGTISETAEDSTVAEEQSAAIVIEVAGEKITADGQAMTDTAALKEYLLQNGGDDKSYILRDNMAVKSAYDSAKAVLDELGWEYAEDAV